MIKLTIIANILVMKEVKIMIGISFEIENEYNSFLSKILFNINTKKYNWYIPFEEVIDNDGNPFFSKDLYLNDYFKTKISKKYYIIHFVC